MPARFITFLGTLLSAVVLSACTAGESGAPATDAYERMDGFQPLYWDAAGGRLLLEIEAFDEPFLYQSSLPRGVGSNDLGLDRGQLGQTRIVRFERSGPRILLVADNLAYRASAESAAERQAVSESFARSVLWGFDAIGESGGAVLVDATPFFLRDAHDLVSRLRDAGEGEYALDASRSAIYLPRTKAFPDNTEVEGIVTFTGQPGGAFVPTVVPDPKAISVHVHHSLIRLPEPGYEPLPYDPRSGVIGLVYESSGFADYSAPIGLPLHVNYGRRHRLDKVNPEAEVSDAVEPIVYYVDPGVPEPVRSALVEGASWWNEAFEAAGYRDAFRVELLPEDADPMDVRYNVIQWVHRSTRGWSYGDAIVDPRTGEILKGHVSLGSLRVRQDYLIAEGLLAPYDDRSVTDAMLEMSLARIRQLSAHEVGHTIGFEHNFAASTQDRASVMDYPFPLVRFDEAGNPDLSAAYAEGIGDWDKRTVLYAYQDFPEGVDEAAARRAIMEETIAEGHAYVADAHARDVSAPHPDGNLWDNGADALAELERLLEVRAYALERFGEANIRRGRPLATIEDALVPIYLLHRFQIEAAGKLLGGVYFNYALRGDGQAPTSAVPEARQRAAITLLVATLEPALLELPDGLAATIPPRPPGYPPTRELFAGGTGVVLDPLAPAAAAATLTLGVLLDPARAARMQRMKTPSFDAVIDALLERTWFAPASAQGDVRRQTSRLLLHGLMRLAADAEASADVRGLALAAIDRLHAWIGRQSPADAATRGLHALASFEIERFRADPVFVGTLPVVTPPPGSPIGEPAP